MQYILTQEEMDALKSRIPVKQYEEKNDTIDQMRDLFVKASGCIHLPRTSEKHMWYCDDCPLADISHACTLSKEFSK